MIDVREPGTLIYLSLGDIVRCILLDHLDDIDVEGDFGGDAAEFDNCLVIAVTCKCNRFFAESGHHETLLRFEQLFCRQGAEVRDYFDRLQRFIIGEKFLSGRSSDLMIEFIISTNIKIIVGGCCRVGKIGYGIDKACIVVLVEFFRYIDRLGADLTIKCKTALDDGLRRRVGDRIHIEDEIIEGVNLVLVIRTIVITGTRFVRFGFRI